MYVVAYVRMTCTEARRVFSRQGELLIKILEEKYYCDYQIYTSQVLLITRRAPQGQYYSRDGVIGGMLKPFRNLCSHQTPMDIVFNC